MTVLLYEEFGTGRHRESSLIRHALGNAHDEALVAGLAGGIGFMYFVFEYPERPPLATIVAQAHPEPWVQVALGRLHVPYDATRSTKPRWGRVRAALDEGHPVFCVVDRSSLPWHEAVAPMPGADAYTVVIAGYEGDDLFIEDGAAAPYRIDREEFGAAWSAHPTGRHQLVVPTGPAEADPDVDGAVAATVTHLTGPVLGNRFDVNFGFSGMARLSADLRDTSTAAAWEQRFGASPETFRGATRRLYASLEEEWTAPGATRPLYADFLDLVGRSEAAGLLRASGLHWSELAALAREADPAADAGERRELFEACAGLVDLCAGLEREAVAVLGG
ncbi:MULTISPECIES: BtrH N-terminal domain-containing protein [unclassified Streptomyces]|uniref:BtrH N-terminal domain-containing protein n=1 Tax=unclassified Streptomyces TaxID=2593676 RepID=UPI002E2EC03A|nr:MULTISPECIES: BtrH N-terminal domain-containing protein [unclassified Streptomyces]WUC67745.1 BtrH N-terminal domain-containing protein [Streptomyces sp. NBC_00539]